MINPANAKVIDIEVNWDAGPVETPDGAAFWATVEIRYALGRLSPALSIRVPVACEGDIGSETCRRQALQSARSLLNHACGAPGLAAMEREETPLQGLSQELGLTPPTAKPRKRAAS